MANNQYIKEKRDSLLSFIHEQLIGPGVCRDRFGVKEDSITGEVINTSPGSVYCSAILFPEKKDNNKEESALSDSSLVNKSLENEMIGVGSEAAISNSAEQNENSNDDDSLEENESLQINQRYPQNLGISVCLDKPHILPSDFRIRISGRYYRKLKVKDAGKLFVRIADEDKDGVSAIARVEIHQGEFSSKMHDYFILEDNKLFLVTSSGNRHGEIKKSLDAIDQIECERFSKQENLERPVFSEIKGFKYLTTYKESLFNRLKSKKTSESEAEHIKEIIGAVEKREAELSYFRELMAILDSRDYGFWYAEDFCKEIDLSEIDFSLLGQQKKSILYKENPAISQVVKYEFEETIEDETNSEDESKKQKQSVTRQASLSLCFQVTKDTRNESNEKTYLKVQLVNTSDAFEETLSRLYSIVTDGVNKRSFFGVKVEVESDFLSPYRHANSFDDADEESERLRYIYRSVSDYGVGHFCSVNWAESKGSMSVWSEFLPEYNIADVDTAPKLLKIKDGEKVVENALSDTTALQIKWLSTLNKEATTKDIVTALEAFVNTYKSWIGNTLNDSSFPKYAKDIQDGCLSDYRRMMANVEMLSEERNMSVFRLMNTAMFIQMWHSQKANQDYIREELEDTEDTSEAFYANQSDDIFSIGQPAAWRPFQLAFILLNLDGIIQRKDDTDWKARNELVDLVWFPTGGGKTESYLGIIALTILYRRISNAKKKTGGGGTTAIMRYTLRLLATQQFQRATRLIFALEQIRKWGNYSLGKEEISIGLFVGNDALPNRLSGDDGLREEASKWQEGKDSKIPLGHCPWCGSELGWDDNNGVFHCKNASCAFGDELPVLLCDELIYKYPPTLLFGTVDKFAMIAHNVDSKKDKDSRRLFRTIDGLTPDLIIQDELHLLQGTLGSAVGLFECAIDYLCSRNVTNSEGKTIRIRPKVISSTATTRNTSLQIKALYDRGVNIFPKNGINYDDSFFAFYKRTIVNNQEEFISKRKYVGILPTGRTAMFVQVRLAACCFVHRAIFELEHINLLNDSEFIKAADYYYSLISYFNSLKEVGTTDVQFYTEFTKYARRLFRRVLRPGKMLQCFYSFDGSMHEAELTGRLSGPEVVKTLEMVQTNWSPKRRLPYNEDGERHPIKTPPDFILATNMISVGIDVSRFNLMIINSMPRNKAEYIQASSRVARDELGIVFTLHNPFRARDLSHFERFREFHEKLYYYVEPISITPFSSKAIERYMPLLLGTITRHLVPELAGNQDANNLTDNQVNKISMILVNYFSERLSRSQLETDSQLKEVFTEESLSNIKDFIANAFSEWKAKRPSKYSYAKDALYISTDSYDEEKESTHWVVPKSVRTVPAGSVIKVNNEI